MNAIIPLFKEKPAQWYHDEDAGKDIESVLRGYLDAFDPDFLTAVNLSSDDLADFGGRNIIDPSSITDQIKELGTPNYGVGYRDLVRHFGQNELKFVRATPISLAVPIVAEEFKPFLSAVVGLLPSEVEDATRKEINTSYKCTEQNCDINNYWTYFDVKLVTPRRMCSQYLRPDQSANIWERNRVLYLDASNLGDVIDYWNLRALGFRVFPFPLQCRSNVGVQQKLADFLLESHGVNRTNSEIVYDATIVRGRSIQATDFESFIQELQTIAPDAEPPIQRRIQPWFPRFWDDFSRKHEPSRRASEYSETDELSVVSESGRLQFHPLVPPFMDDYTFGGGVANELYLSTYTEDEPVAEVFPVGGKELLEAIGVDDFFSPRWRFSTDGLVYLCDWHKLSVSLAVPVSQRVFEAWLKTQGWEVEVSSAGRAIRQLIKNLGGKHGISLVADEEILAMLNEIAKKSVVNDKWLRGEAWKIAKRRNWKNGLGFVSRLIESQLIVLGVQIQCPNCRQRPWYDLRQLDYSVECTKCLVEFQTPTHDSRELEWAYRAAGPLVSLATVSGAFGVLLAYRFFHATLNWRLTPAFGVSARQTNRESEIDFGCLLQAAEYGPAVTRLLFAECKSFNFFKDVDIRRISEWGELHPGSILVFSTLRKELTAEERRELSSAADPCRRYWKDDTPRNFLMILTGNELFGRFAPQDSWKELGGKHEQLSSYIGQRLDLHRFCDATQQLYLGMEPIRQTWEKEIREKAAERT